MDQSEAAKIFAAMGGRAKSKAKSAAARRNGKKGGRPKGSKGKHPRKTPA